jgi:hypothetical protein
MVCAPSAPRPPPAMRPPPILHTGLSTAYPSATTAQNEPPYRESFETLQPYALRKSDAIRDSNRCTARPRVRPEAPSIAHGRPGMRRMTQPSGLKCLGERRCRGYNRRIRDVFSSAHPLVNGVQLVLTLPEQTFGPMTVGPVGYTCPLLSTWFTTRQLRR